MKIDPRNIPWFFRKKALIITAIVLGVLLLAGIGFTIPLYLEHRDDYFIPWKRVLIPMELPLIGLMIYAIIILLWVLQRLLEVRNRVLVRAPSLIRGDNVEWMAGEVLKGQVSCTYIPPYGFERKGTLRMTTHRLMHMPASSVQRSLTTMLAENPETTLSFPFFSIERCGFGLDPQHMDSFIIITRQNEWSRFTMQPVPRELPQLFAQLGWQQHAMGNQLFWTPQ